jgi:acetyl-CoA C-acetyltransferase
MPVGYYAIIESAFRAYNGWDVDSHRDRLASLLSRFSRIAAANPEAWSRTPLDEHEIRDPSPTNQLLAFPYTRRHTSSWSVDQASALLLCSTGLASHLQIPPSKWVFPLASTESNHMVSLSARTELHRSPGARIAGQAALDAGEVEVPGLDLIELYSCFPIAVEVYAAELGIAMDRDLTVTGGMPFAGGPFNHYTFLSTCRMARLLRGAPGSRGLVSSVSGVLTKQGFGLWATDPGPNAFTFVDVTAKVAALQTNKAVVSDYSGGGRIVGYTVMLGRNPPRAVAVIDVANNTRTIAFNDDEATIAQMQRIELCGTGVRVADGCFDLG